MLWRGVSDMRNGKKQMCELVKEINGERVCVCVCVCFEDLKFRNDRKTELSCLGMGGVREERSEGRYWRKSVESPK